MQLARLCTVLAGVSLIDIAYADMSVAQAETSVQYAYALTSSEDKVLAYGADSTQLHTLRLQHESDYAFGSNFLLYDQLKSNKPLGGPVFGPNDPNNYAYGDGNKTYFWVAGTELHANKIFDHSAGNGVIKDWGLSARLEGSGYYDYKAKELGPQVHLNVAGFDQFKLTLWRRWKSDISGSAEKMGYDVGQRKDYRDSWLIGADWKTHWTMWGYEWTSQAFIRYQLGDGGKKDARGNENINGIPSRLWLEPDIFIKISPHLAIGLRDYYLWQTDAIDNGYSDKGQNAHHVPQIVLKISF